MTPSWIRAVFARPAARPAKPARPAAKLTVAALEDRVVPAYTLQLLHASDLEPGLNAPADAPRFAAVVQYLEEDRFAPADPRKAAFDGSVLLSSGDNFIPGPFYAASSDPSLNDVLNAKPGATTGTIAGPGRAGIEVMNRIGFDASVIGNHEFDAGVRELNNVLAPADAGTPPTAATRFYRGTTFPYLSANLTFPAGNDLAARVANAATRTAELTNAQYAAGRIAPSAVIDPDGAGPGTERVGVIGLTTPLLASISSTGNTVISPSNPNDLQALADIVNAQVVALTAAAAPGGPVNKVILVSHLQSLSVENNLIPLLSGVDVVIAGGSSTLLADPNDPLRAGDTAADGYPLLRTGADSNPVLLVSTDEQFSYVGRLVLPFDENGVIDTAALDADVNGVYSADAAGVERLYGAGTAGTFRTLSTKAEAVGQVTDAVGGVIQALDANQFGRTNVYLNGLRAEVRDQETNLGSLTADANLFAARQLYPAINPSDTRFIGVSLKNAGGIRDSIGATVADGPDLGQRIPPRANPDAGKEDGEISQLDIENALRFNNGLSVLTATGPQLRTLLEHGFASLGGQGRFPQVGGVEVTYDPARPANFRITRLTAVDVNNRQVVVVADGRLTPAGRAATFRVVTLGFLADGGDGYPFAANSSERTDLAPVTGNAFATPGSEQNALATYLAATFPADSDPATPVFAAADTPPAQDARIRTATPAAAPFTLTPVSGVTVTGGAEISAFDRASKNLFVTKNSGGVPSIDVISLANPAAPGAPTNVDLSAFGGEVSSVAVRPADGLVAVAMIAANRQAAGKVVFLTAAGTVQGSVTVGSQPDQLTFAPDGRLLVAIEGEPANYNPTTDPAVNPAGGVSIVSPNAANLSGSPVAFAGFGAFDTKLAALKAAGVRVLDNGTPVSLQLEPEYIAVAPDGRSARVSLQEANAFGVLDLVTNTFTAVQPLGFTDHSQPGFELDASDKDSKAGNIRNQPVRGLPMPDAVASYAVGGKTYYVTANEGDARVDDSDVARLSDNTAATPRLDVAAEPRAAFLTLPGQLGRLNFSTLDFTPVAGADPYDATLTGAQEVPTAVTTTASGVARATLSAGNVLSVSLNVSKLDFGTARGLTPTTPATADDVTRIHIHRAARGANGPVVWDIVEAGSNDDDLTFVTEADGSVTVTAKWEATDGKPLTQEFVDLLRGTADGADAEFYFNVHTTGNPGGEIRGQVLASKGVVVTGTPTAFGTRSFSIYNADGTRVFDSGSDFELITLAKTPGLFNANDGISSKVDTRSDDKGPEPEGVVTGVVNGRTYAFVGLERAGGGVMVYDVTDPVLPTFVQYAFVNNLDASAAGDDVSPEGLVFVPAADSPSGVPLLIVSNEVSGTVRVYELTLPANTGAGNSVRGLQNASTETVLLASFAPAGGVTDPAAYTAAVAGASNLAVTFNPATNRLEVRGRLTPAAAGATNVPVTLTGGGATQTATATVSAAAALNRTGAVRVTTTGVRFDRRTGTFVSGITLSNPTAAAVDGPFRVVLTGLAANVGVTATIGGQPVSVTRTAAGAVLAIPPAVLSRLTAGQSSPQLQVVFTVPAGQRLTFGAEVFGIDADLPA